MADWQQRLEIVVGIRVATDTAAICMGGLRCAKMVSYTEWVYGPTVLTKGQVA